MAGHHGLVFLMLITVHGVRGMAILEILGIVRLNWKDVFLSIITSNDSINGRLKKWIICEEIHEGRGGRVEGGDWKTF